MHRRSRGGGDAFFDFDDPFAGFGGFPGQRSLISDFFGGRDPFDDPFFRSPFGSMFESSFFGGSGIPFANMHASGFLDHQPPEAKRPRGLIIEEINSDDEKEAEKESKNTKSSSKDPIVEGPDDEGKSQLVRNVMFVFLLLCIFSAICVAVSKGVSFFVVSDKRNQHLQLVDHHSRPNQRHVRPQANSFTFQSSSVTYGSSNGTYYTSSRTRRAGSDGVSELKCLQEVDSLKNTSFLIYVSSVNRWFSKKARKLIPQPDKQPIKFQEDFIIRYGQRKLDPLRFIMPFCSCIY